MDVKDTGWGSVGGGYMTQKGNVLGSSNTVINTAVFRDVMMCSLVEPPTVWRILVRLSSLLKTLGEDQDKVPSHHC
jgi:hypothetical protein